LLLAFLWSVDIIFLFRHIPIIGKSAVAAVFIPGWFYFNFKWGLRAVKIPFMFFTVNSLFKELGIAAPFSYRLALAFDKIGVYKEYSKIKVLRNETAEEYIARNFFILPSLILEQENIRIKELSLNAYKHYDLKDFYRQHAGTAVGSVTAGIILGAFILPNIFFMLFAGSDFDMTGILNTYFSAPIFFLARRLS
jgi:hypothetical protein